MRDRLKKLAAAVGILALATGCGSTSGDSATTTNVSTTSEDGRPDTGSTALALVDLSDFEGLWIDPLSGLSGRGPPLSSLAELTVEAAKAEVGSIVGDLRYTDESGVSCEKQLILESVEEPTIYSIEWLGEQPTLYNLRQSGGDCQPFAPDSSLSLGIQPTEVLPVWLSPASEDEGAEVVLNYMFELSDDDPSDFFSGQFWRPRSRSVCSQLVEETTEAMKALFDEVDAGSLSVSGDEFRQDYDELLSGLSGFSEETPESLVLCDEPTRGEALSSLIEFHNRQSIERGFSAASTEFIRDERGYFCHMATGIDLLTKKAKTVCQQTD